MKNFPESAKHRNTGNFLFIGIIFKKSFTNAEIYDMIIKVLFDPFGIKNKNNGIFHNVEE